MIGHYQSARAFRAALEDRLKQFARAQSTDLMHLRRQVAFDRLFARLCAEPEPDPPWLLKGGYAFELRWDRAARRVSDALKQFCMQRYGTLLEPPFRDQWPHLADARNTRGDALVICYDV